MVSTSGGLAAGNTNIGSSNSSDRSIDWTAAAVKR
jgi:hypothetical protein